MARGASPFLIESRLRAYILSSIGAVGSVSAAKRVGTVTRGRRLGRRWRANAGARERVHRWSRGGGSTDRAWKGGGRWRTRRWWSRWWGGTLFANANFKITNF